MNPPPGESPRVVIVGGGPAGLTGAVALRALGHEVVVLEREAAAGGIPRHSDHAGYGLRDLHRFVSGPEYARRLAARATAAGADVRTHSTVTGWAGPHAVEVTSPAGREVIAADAVVLATGARERPRSARLVPGDRPVGVYTTGQLQNAVHLLHRRLPGPAVVVGSEAVSWSAALTLRAAGADRVTMVTAGPRVDAYRAFEAAGRAALQVPVLRRTVVAAVVGRDRVEAVDVTGPGAPGTRRLPCATVVFTADWIPDHELVRLAGLELDPASRGPVVDPGLRTSTPGVFAVGNLVHPVDTADLAALDGAHAAAAVHSWLVSGATPRRGPRIQVTAPLLWVTPQTTGGRPPHGRLSAWVTELVRTPTVRADQDGRVVGRVRTPWPAAPGRVFRIPARLLAAVDPFGGPVELTLS